VFRRILVGFDGSPDAQRALRIAIAMAVDLRAATHVLLVVRQPPHAETAEELAAAAEAERERLSLGLSGVGSGSKGGGEVTTHVVFGDDPAKTIAGYAQEHGFDLVVVGGHGREHVVHRGIGHSLEALLQHHPCPVLVA
jgi:nucleotide-binding universal stress UspA family protein